jgi:hypothetical protein
MTVEYVKKNGPRSVEALYPAHTGDGTAHELAFNTAARDHAQSPSPPSLKDSAIKSGVLLQSASCHRKAQPGSHLPIEPDTSRKIRKGDRAHFASLRWRLPSRANAEAAMLATWDIHDPLQSGITEGNTLNRSLPWGDCARGARVMVLVRNSREAPAKNTHAIRSSSQVGIRTDLGSPYESRSFLIAG